MKHYFPSKGRVLFAHLFILLSLVASGCGGAATATELPVTGAPATEVPTELPTEVPTEAPTEAPVTEVPATDPPGQGVNLTLLYPGTPDSTEGTFISDAVALFQEQKGISVDLQFVSGSDYLAILTTQVQAGDPPDIAKLAFFDLFQFYGQGSLLSIEEAGGSIDDFLEDAQNSVLFNEQHYGLPQRRDSCALAYDYLSIFNGAQYSQEAFLLVDFLTHKDLQAQAYEQLQWYPTRSSLSDELGLCPINEAIRLPEEVLQEVYDQIPERSQGLEPYLEGGIVLVEEATGVFENEELVGFTAPVWTPIPYSPEEGKELMATTGVVMGVLFINEVPEYPPGDYVIKCFTLSCVLVDREGKELDYKVEMRGELETPMEVPRAAIVPGSKITCVWKWIFYVCTRVG